MEQTSTPQSLRDEPGPSSNLPSLQPVHCSTRLPEPAETSLLAANAAVSAVLAEAAAQAACAVCPSALHVSPGVVAGDADLGYSERIVHDEYVATFLVRKIDWSLSCDRGPWGLATLLFSCSEVAGGWLLLRICT